VSAAIYASLPAPQNFEVNQMQKLLLATALALFCAGCESVNNAAARNQSELPSNPDAGEQAKPSPSPLYSNSEPAQEYEQAKGGAR